MLTRDLHSVPDHVQSCEPMVSHSPLLSIETTKGCGIIPGTILPLLFWDHIRARKCFEIALAVRIPISRFRAVATLRV